MLSLTLYLGTWTLRFVSFALSAHVIIGKNGLDDFLGVSDPLSLLLGPPFFPINLVHPPVNWDDRHLIEHSMASGFTIAGQYSQREQLVRVGRFFQAHLVTVITIATR
jgi:hypothetical protein